MKTKILKVIILILIILPITTIPKVKADGSVTPQEIYAYAKHNGIWGMGDGHSNDGHSIYENSLRGTRYELPADTQGWSVSIYRTKARIYGLGGTTCEAKIGIYTDGGAHNPVNYCGESDAEDTQTGTYWEYFDFSTPAPIPLNATNFWGIIWGESVTGSFYICYDSSASNSIAKDQTYGTFPDPLTGESPKTDEIYNLCQYPQVEKNTTTTHNQYYGTASKYTARRDINITYPSGVYDRKIKITYPSSNEFLFNITYSNGGLWNEKLSEEQYTDTILNNTHNVIEIPESTIDLKGTAYRLFTSSFPYLYTFKGLYTEDGSRSGNVTITAHMPSNTTEYLIDGERIIGFNDKPVQFVWELPGGVYRQLYTQSNIETFHIFEPETNYTIYGFKVKDYCGYLSQGDTFLEALRVINGTEHLIQRAKVQDSITSIPMILCIYRIYVLQVRTPDGDTYRFGYYTTGVDPELILKLKGMSFSQQVQMSYKYVAMEATRITDTHIKATYLDELNLTGTVKMEVWYRENYTVAYSDSSTGASVEFNWLNADNETDYIVHLEANHEKFNPSKEFPLSGATGAFTGAPDLSVIGTWGPIASNAILPVSLILIIAGIADEKTAFVVSLICWGIAAGLYSIGWYDISPFMLAGTVALIILAAIGSWK